MTNLETSKVQVKKAFKAPKIYSLDNDEQIRYVLKHIFVMVGLQNIPTREEFAVLIQFIQKNYSMYSVDEIKIAFELALKGDFIVDEKSGTKHFGIFSCSYLSDVLSAYSKYRERIAKEYMIEQERIKNEQEQNREISDEEKHKLKKDFFHQVLKPLFDNYKEKKKLNFGLTPVRIVYMTLRDEYKIINLSDQEMIQIKDKAKEQLDDKVKTCKMTGQKKTKKEIWTELCRTKAIELSFDYLISNKKELKF